MINTLSALYELALHQYPYTPQTPSEVETAQRLEQALAFQFPREYRHAVFELKDSLDI